MRKYSRARHDIDAYLEYYADDAILIEYSGLRLNEEGVRKIMSDAFVAFPDLKYKFERMVSQGDMVVVESTGSVTHKREYHGLPATNNKFELPRVSIYDFEAGKVKQVKTYANARANPFLFVNDIYTKQINYFRVAKQIPIQKGK